MAKKQNSAKKRAGGKTKKSVKRPAPAGIPVPKTVSSIRPKRTMKMNHVSTVCSITDPFCIHARGAQRPDGGPPTIPFQIRALVQITGDGTTGTARTVFVPNVLFPYTWADTVTGNWQVKADWKTVNGTGFVSDYAKEIRITSFGVVVRSAMTATTAKGLVILSTDNHPLLGATVPKGSMANAESKLVTLAAGMEHAWVSKPMGSTAHMFQPISKYTNTLEDLDWTSLVVEVTGSDTTSGTAFLSVEIVMNVEFTVLGGSTTTAVAQLQKTPPVPNRAAIAASEHSHATRPSFIEGGIAEAASFLERKAKEGLDAILSDGMALLFG